MVYWDVSREILVKLSWASKNTTRASYKCSTRLLRLPERLYKVLTSPGVLLTATQTSCCILSPQTWNWMPFSTSTFSTQYLKRCLLNSPHSCILSFLSLQGNFIFLSSYFLLFFYSFHPLFPSLRMVSFQEYAVVQSLRPSGDKVPSRLEWGVCGQWGEQGRQKRNLVILGSATPGQSDSITKLISQTSK